MTTEFGDVDPAEADALIALRTLLEEAILRCADPSAVGRRIAVVLLDGAAEAAIGLCLAHFDVSSADKLDGSHSKLVEQLRVVGTLGATERLPGWTDVSRLRRVRNNAQHHQVTPDHATLVAWTASVQRFVDAAVRCAFGLGLSQVTRSGAITDPELRAQFHAAELELTEGRTAGAIRSLTTVFRSARAKWEAEYRDATRLSVPSRPRRDSIGVVDAIEAVTKPVEDLLSVAPFVLDLGEYVWWQSLSGATQYSGDSAEVSDTDVTRAFVFVFTWIIRWEAFSATYTRDRLGRQAPIRPQPSPRPDGAPEFRFDTAHIDRIRVHGLDDPRMYLCVEFAAGRANDTAPHRWDRGLHEALANASTLGLWKESILDGRGEIRFLIDADTDMAQIRVVLETMIDDAGRRTLAAEQQSQKQEAETQRQFAAVHAALTRVATSNGELAFSDVQLARTHTLDGSAQGMAHAYFDESLRAAATRRVRVRGARPQPTVGLLHGPYYEVAISVVPEDAAAGARQAVDLLEAFAAREQAAQEASAAAHAALTKRLLAAFAEATTDGPATP